MIVKFYYGLQAMLCVYFIIYSLHIDSITYAHSIYGKNKPTDYDNNNWIIDILRGDWVHVQNISNYIFNLLNFTC